MDVATFQLNFPAFAQTDQTFVQAALNAAAARMGGPDGRVWGTFATAGQPPNQADFAQGNYAAYVLLCDPLGGPTRMDPTKAKESVYFKRWEELMYARTTGIAVARGRPRFRFPFGFFP